MPTLPQPVKDCPSPDCGAPIGAKHSRDCDIAICVSTGYQRIVHTAIAPDGLLPAPELAAVDADFVDVHICGEDVWSGYPHGTIEAVAAGLYVRERRTGRGRRWLRCKPSHPDAKPDLERVTRIGDWDMIRQVWVLPNRADT